MAEIMKEQAQEASVLDALLGATVPNVEKDLPTARYKVDRLSQAAGRDVVFTLRRCPTARSMIWSVSIRTQTSTSCWPDAWSRI